MSQPYGSSPSADLPDCFQRPRRLSSHQSSLFREPFHQALAKLKLSVDEVRRWADAGWLSFNPDELSEVAEHGDEVTLELGFVSDLVRSGVSDSQLQCLIAEVGLPLSFNPHLVVWSFRYGWVEPADEEVPVLGSSESQLEACRDWVSQEEDVVSLEALKDQICSRLNELNDRNGEQDSDHT